MTNRTLLFSLLAAAVIGGLAGFGITRALTKKPAPLPCPTDKYQPKYDSLLIINQSLQDRIIILRHQRNILEEKNDDLIKRINTLSKSDIIDWRDRFMSNN